MCAQVFPQELKYYQFENSLYEHLDTVQVFIFRSVELLKVYLTILITLATYERKFSACNHPKVKRDLMVA